MAGRIPDVVEVYRHKCLKWVYMTANYYKDIPLMANVYLQDDAGVIHENMQMTPVELYYKVKEEHWIFVEKLSHQWFDPCALRMEEK